MGCASQICSRNINFPSNTLASTKDPRAKTTFLLWHQMAFSLMKPTRITVIYEKHSNGSNQFRVCSEAQM